MNSEHLFPKPPKVKGREYVPPQLPSEEPISREGKMQAYKETSLELSPMRKEELKKAMARQVKDQLGK